LVNDLGLQVLTLCDGHSSLAQISRTIAQRYAQPLTSVQQDVLAFVDTLYQRGFLASTLPDGAEASGTPQPRALHVSVTNECNLRCIHCAVLGGISDHLPGRQIRRIIDEFVILGGTAIAITGGEPLTRPDWLGLLRHGAAKARTRLLTNATLLGPHQAREVADLQVEVQVSLDGADAASHDAVRGDGAFARAMRGIELLLHQGAGDRLTLCMTLMRHNIAQVPDMIRLAARLGIAAIRFLPLQPLGLAAESWTALRPGQEQRQEAYRYLYRLVPRQGQTIRISGGLPGFALAFGQAERWCRVGRKLYVDADGSVYPCDLMAQRSFRLGDARQQPLAEILASAGWRELMATVVSREQHMTECQACLWRNFCQGGCPAVGHHQAGSLLATDDLCDFRRQLYRDVAFSLADQAAGGSRQAPEPAC
jgi:radical SAM protein with 4Fe4S-binding SPASM domain